MKKILNIILKLIPFAAVITLNVFADIKDFDLELLKPITIIIGIILLLNLMATLIVKLNDYFIYGISTVGLLGMISVFLFPSLGQLYIDNVIVGLYLGLFIIAVFPPLFKVDPFTFSFSLDDYPEAIGKSQLFLKINLIINYIWAGLFAIAMILTKVTYSENLVLQIILAMVIPIILQLSIGLPATIKLPGILMQNKGGDQMTFETVKDLFEAMPFGLNKEKAVGVDSLIQFFLTGDEPTEGHLEIKDLKCTFTDGIHPNPKTTIHADSKLWLGISNNYISGSKALMNNEYQVEGDAGILLKLSTMFAPSKKEEKKTKPMIQNKVDKYSKTFEPGKFKKIVVFDGGPRGAKYSKTSFMVRNFIEGAEEAGATAEYFKLKDYDIHTCSGCYHCWTKTPGECIYKDDMTMLRKKYREADLIVFASPLYVYNVTGLFKTFMDRIIPVLKPYMLIDEQGFIKHPDRYPELGDQGFVVFSAGGFPDVAHNFDGLTSMFQMLNDHTDNLHMVGEFYLPAAEFIVQPVYRDRKIAIQVACKQAGTQIVSQGKIDPKLMHQVSDPGFSAEVFQEQSDGFWGSIEGKSSYLKEVPKL